MLASSAVAVAPSCLQVTTDVPNVSHTSACCLRQIRRNLAFLANATSVWLTVSLGRIADASLSKSGL